MIAGEASGDFLGAAILKRLNGFVDVCGVGGDLMMRQGFQSLFNISEISVGGIMEVIPHVLRIKRLINMTANDIIDQRPDVVLTIDSPGFCFRVAKKVRDIAPEIKLVHFVAPSVWAWRSKRAIAIAELYDALLTLFSFEPKYFEKYGLKTTFVGHPAVEVFSPTDKEKSEILLLMPGSRIQEIKSHLPIFIDVAKSLGAKNVVIPTLPNLEGFVRSMTDEFKADIVIDETEKAELYRMAKLAIVASGTATLQLALSGCPMVVCYRISKLTYSLVRPLVKIKFISLVNILLNEQIVPELIQSDCEPKKILEQIDGLDPEKQLSAFKKIGQLVQNQEARPSVYIADILLKLGD